MKTDKEVIADLQKLLEKAEVTKYIPDGSALATTASQDKVGRA